MQTQTMKLRELTIRYAVRKDHEGQPVIVGRAHEPSEVFIVLCLTTKCHVIAYHEVGRGTLDTVLVNPREVFKAAVLANAAAIVVAHNHPSGDPTPSPDDMDVTRRLAAAGGVLGIAVLDHIIVGDGRYYSFKEGGLV
jgi:DNA repair protein RadC